MTTTKELLNLEIRLRNLELQTLEGRKRLESQKNPIPLPLRLFVGVVCAAGLLTAILLLVKAIIG